MFLLICAPFDSNLIDELSHFSLLLRSYSKSDQETMMDAAYWASLLHADQKRASGEPYFIHPLSVAKTLVDMKMDAATIIAALLHDIEEDTTVTREDIALRYGNEVEQLVNSVTKISIRNLSSKVDQLNKTIFKIFLAMATDMRVMMIKLSDKLHNMKTLQFKRRDKQIKTAQECLDIYAPVTRTLGIYWLKMLLEDLSLRHINHTLYQNIITYQLKNDHRTKMLLEPIIDNISRQYSSPKGYHIIAIPRNHYAIYRQLHLQSQPLNHLRYPYGIRVICQTEADCYNILATIHRLYKPLNGHFKDYITLPKENRYQSLHTTVMSNTGRPLEVQVRTTAMDQMAEHGISAFWVFKNEHNFNPQDSSIVQKIKRWESLPPEPEMFVRELHHNMMHDTLTIFNQEGEARQLAVGSTALDYAFSQGSAIGLGCRAIKIDDHHVEFDALLDDNQRVTVVSHPSMQPKLAWLQQVTYPWAKVQITQWYHSHQYDIFSSNDLMFTWPLDEKPPESIELACCCKPNPSHQPKAVSDKGRVIIHQEGCLSMNKDDQFFEVIWLHPTKPIYRYSLELPYLPNPLGRIEKIINQAGSRLLDLSFPHAGRPKRMAIFTVEVATKAKRLALEEALNREGMIQTVECL